MNLMFPSTEIRELQLKESFGIAEFNCAFMCTNKAAGFTSAVDGD